MASATTVVFQVGAHGDFLSTRRLGRGLLRRLQDRTPADTELLIIDFAAVEAVTVGFTDEFLGNYYAALATRADGPTTVMVAGLNDDTRETVAIGLERRELVALEQASGELSLLAASEVLQDTFQLAKGLDSFTSTTVSEVLGITGPNANNRLKRLVAARALTRRSGVAEHGGKQFTYLAPPAP